MVFYNHAKTSGRSGVDDGAVVPVNGGPQMRYQLNIAIADGVIDTITTLPDDDVTPLNTAQEVFLPQMA